MDTSKNIADIPEWFKGCQLNYAENLLENKDDNKVALITYGNYSNNVGGVSYLMLDL